jgi:hypothetical protein
MAHCPGAQCWVRSRLFLPMLRCCILTIAAVFCLVSHSSADVAVPPNVLTPGTNAEAWNVIRLAMTNIDRLVQESRLTEIPVQISLCSPALRTLARLANTPEDAEAVSKLTTRALGWVIAVARTARENNPNAVHDGLRQLKTVLEELGQRYDPKLVKGEIYVCPMHSDIISEAATTPCAKCSMQLVTRRIPYSFIYTSPGEPSVVMTATASGPCEAGKKLDVKVRLATKDKKPVLTGDLMVMHTEPIHLLIETPSLSDYHHEHPVATDVPGEYAFSFIPRETAPYRIWADIVPNATGLQELPSADLPSRGEATPVKDTANRHNAAVDGYQFALSLAGGNHIPVVAGQVRKMNVTVTDASGQPVQQLEPVMNAFAHLVGFYDDYRTVVHLHPTGGDILNEEARGGPSLGFQFFPPKPGFIRLYCQVMIGGKMLFAPLGVTVVGGTPN